MNDQLSIKPTPATPAATGTAVLYNRVMGGGPSLSIRAAVSDPALHPASRRELRVGHALSKGTVRTLVALDTNRAILGVDDVFTGSLQKSSVKFQCDLPASGMTEAEFLESVKVLVVALTDGDYALAKSIFNREL